MSWSDADVAEEGWSDADVVASRKPPSSSGIPRLTASPDFEAPWAERIAANPATRFALGAAAPVLGLMELIPGDVGRRYAARNKDVAELIKRGKTQQSAVTRAVGAGSELVGNVLSPVFLKATKMMPVAKTLPGMMKQGAAIGGVAGLTTPTGVSVSDDAEAKLAQGSIGAAFGVALPAAIATGKYVGRRVGDVANLITPGGAERIADKYVNTIISEANKGELSLALQNADELLRGSKPTAAQAVAHLPSGSPIQAHQKLVSQESGGISAKFGQRIADQRAAGQKALSFAGTEDEIKALVAARTAAVTPLYDAVKASTASVKSAPVVRVINDIIKDNVNRDAISGPLRKIRNALVVQTDKGWRLENNPQKLKSLSDNIGDMMGKKTVDGKNEFDVKVLRQIKEKLDEQIGAAEPFYAQAQRVFADMSKPINTMQIGSTLKDKLLNASGTETPGTFLRAWDNEKKLMKEATGFGRKGTSSYLTPQQMDDVSSLVKDLERNVSSKNPLQKTDLRGGVNVAGETTVSIPNLLSRPAMMANYVLKMAGRNIEPEIDDYLARLYLNPKELGKVLSKVAPAQRTRFNAIVQSYSTVGAVKLQSQQEETE